MQRIWKCRRSVSVMRSIVAMCIALLSGNVIIVAQCARCASCVRCSVCCGVCCCARAPTPQSGVFPVCVAVGVDTFAVLHDGTNDKVVSLKKLCFLICTMHSNLRDYFYQFFLLWQIFCFQIRDNCKTSKTSPWRIFFLPSLARQEGRPEAPLQHHCNTLQNTATHCNTLQHQSAIPLVCSTTKTGKTSIFFSSSDTVCPEVPHVYVYTQISMGWLRLVGSLKDYVSFAEYSLFCRVLLQKRPIILRSLLIVATP